MRADDFLFSTGGNWTEVECLLDLWFTAGETRTSVLPFDGSKFSQSSAQLAGKIFKRGGKGIRDVAAGNRDRKSVV